MRKKTKWAMLTAVSLILAVLAGCGRLNVRTEAEKEDSHLTVFLWQSQLLTELVPYIRSELPDQEIEFLVGNNDLDLYAYLQEHGDLPDIITTRRFSANDAKMLQPYLMDFAPYDVVSGYYPYALQYYKNTDGEIQWLPVCGIPETTIVNKTLLDQYGLQIPENYEEFAQLCQKLHDCGVKPYIAELADDWAAHSLLQGAAIDQFVSLDGLEWRTKAESAVDEIAFDDGLWNQIMKELGTFIKDTYLGEPDTVCGLSTAKSEFIAGNAAMFRGTPEVMEYLESQMDAELVRLPYFSQTSDESWIYTYPSLNIAFNKELEQDEEKLDTALKVLDCFISEEGQKRIAGGNSVISYNADADSVMDDMEGIESEVENNEFYIRYGSNNSFAASLIAVQGMLTGSMDEKAAYEAFRNELNSVKTEEKTITFEKDASIFLNGKGGRDAASSILTTVRKAKGVQLAFVPYTYFSSSIYKGTCTEKQLELMTAENTDTPVYLEKMTGDEIRKLVQSYLSGNTDGLLIAAEYELPAASGMKLILQKQDDQFVLKEILIGTEPIKNEETYTILLTHGTINAYEAVNPDQELKALENTSFSKIWKETVMAGNEPSEPEDYIEIQP